jgi:plastocyanin
MTHAESSHKGVAMTNRASLLLIVPFVLLSLAFIMRASQAASTVLDTVNVSASDFQFTPAQITINVGDTVQWANEGGLHSVVADDGSFTSGPASTSAWTYDFTFNTPGTFQYYCVIHGFPGGGGMSGIITVQGEPPILDRDIYLPAILK